MPLNLRIVKQENFKNGTSWFYISPSDKNYCIQWFSSLNEAEKAKKILEKTVDCCELGNKYLTYRTAKKCYGPTEDGPSMLIDFDAMDAYGIYENVVFCPFCGLKLSTEL